MIRTTGTLVINIDPGLSLSDQTRILYACAHACASSVSKVVDKERVVLHGFRGNMQMRSRVSSWRFGVFVPRSDLECSNGASISRFGLQASVGSSKTKEVKRIDESLVFSLPGLTLCNPGGCKEPR